MVRGNEISIRDGVGIWVQPAGKFTKWTAYGERRVEDVWVLGDNTVAGGGFSWVGQGASNINILRPAA
jgi:hypothetical protein